MYVPLGIVAQDLTFQSPGYVCMEKRGGIVVCHGYMFADWKSKRNLFGHWFRMIKDFVVCGM